MMSLIKQRKAQMDRAKTIVEDWSHIPFSKSSPEELEQIKNALVDVIIIADTQEDNDAPSVATRRKLRNEAIGHASAIIKEQKEKLQHVTNDLEKQEIVDKTITCTDIYTALTSKSNAERKKIYDNTVSDDVIMATHSVTVFQVAPDVGLQVIYYDNIVNNDEVYEQYANAKTREEKVKIINDNIELASIFVLSIHEGVPRGYTHALLKEPLPTALVNLTK